MYHGWNGSGWNGGSFGIGFPWGGIALVALFVVLVALAVIAIVRSGKALKLSGGTTNERGLEILTERFARGEIDADTFRAMKLELNEKGIA